MDGQGPGENRKNKGQEVAKLRKVKPTQRLLKRKQGLRCATRDRRRQNEKCEQYADNRKGVEGSAIRTGEMKLIGSEMCHTRLSEKIWKA